MKEQRSGDEQEVDLSPSVLVQLAGGDVQSLSHPLLV